MAEHEFRSVAGRRTARHRVLNRANASSRRGARRRAMTLEDLAAEFGVSREACAADPGRAFEEGAVGRQGACEGGSRRPRSRTDARVEMPRRQPKKTPAVGAVVFLAASTQQVSSSRNQGTGAALLSSIIDGSPGRPGDDSRSSTMRQISRDVVSTAKLGSRFCH